MDSGGFGDEQSTRSACPLSIILKGKISMDVLLVRPIPRHRTEDDAMFEVHTTNADRLKEFRCRRHVEVNRCKETVGVRRLKMFDRDFPMGCPFNLLFVAGRAAVFGFHSFAEEPIEDAQVRSQAWGTPPDYCQEGEKNRGQADKDQAP